MTQDDKGRRLVTEYLANAETIEQLENRQKQIKEMLAELLPEGGTIDGHKVAIVAAPGRLDTKRLAAAFPPNEFPQLYKIAPDTTAIKQHVAPTVLESYKTYGQPQVRIS